MSYCESGTGICVVDVFLLMKGTNWILWWSRYFLNEGTQNGENLLADMKLEDGAVFRILSE